jgi:GNAT superfamily N-acetyltransferase
MAKNIKIDKSISLQRLKLSDQSALFVLMKKIYTPVYAHLWPDNGEWYLNKIYGKENFEKDIADTQGRYFFVLLEGAKIGILFLQYDKILENFPAKKTLKLNKIYLDPAIHGKSIGKKIMQWINEEARRSKCEIIWLEAMDSQEQAIKFYEKCGFKIISKFQLDIEMMYPKLKGMYIMSRNENLN